VGISVSEGEVEGGFAELLRGGGNRGLEHGTSVGDGGRWTGWCRAEGVFELVADLESFFALGEVGVEIGDLLAEEVDLLEEKLQSGEEGWGSGGSPIRERARRWNGGGGGGGVGVVFGVDD
jgi:hypothetical protein